MAMATTSLQDHKALIICLFKHHLEEEIAEYLCSAGIATTLFEVRHYLELWNIISCPSPVHSQDADAPSDEPRPSHDGRLGVTCHHGETSHPSQTSLAMIPSGSDPIERFGQDTQYHERFACGVLPESKREHGQVAFDPQGEIVLDPKGPVTLGTQGQQVIEASDDDGYMNEADLIELLHSRRQVRDTRYRVNLSKNRLARGPRVKDRGAVQKVKAGSS